ncbi:intercompartmental signaling factor BofC [Bacillus sp. FJAT-47783]|uniref:intercompartmental signaling factor BofC n=1 Tax=Bacillus sp. FJAT-47783 TaxID=2922712 RepID=UPI001FADC68E|nr:intercompartmental signaling factor BofC [Bacillus sp. FJAT-47783]
MRRVHHLFFLISLIMLFFVMILLGSSFANEEQTSKKHEAYEVTGPITVKVVLERIYMDGEKSEELKEETIWSMEDFWSQYAEWQLITQNEDKIVFQKYIDDISPLLKTNGYFGIQEDGTLSIFNGRPVDTHNIIQSFFQIDVGKLETSRHQELKNGIPIKNKNQYLEVIETFKQYSIDNVQ